MTTCKFSARCFSRLAVPVIMIGMTGACQHAEPPHVEGFVRMPPATVNCHHVDGAGSGGDISTVSAKITQAVLPQCRSGLAGQADVLVQVALSERHHRLSAEPHRSPPAVSTIDRKGKKGTEYVVQIHAEDARNGEILADASARQTVRKPLDTEARAALAGRLAQLIAALNGPVVSAPR